MFNFPTFWTTDFPLNIIAQPILGRGDSNLPSI